VKTTDELLMETDPEVLRDLSGAGLYDLRNDIGEQHDVAVAKPDKVEELARDWQRWNATLAKPLFSAAQMRW
jgi:hypothetical protein